MALDGGTAIVRVIADASKLNATIAASTRGATSGLAGLGSRVTSALTNPIVVAGGVVAGVAAKMGFDFEDAFTRIDAISNASAQDIARWREQVMLLSGRVAKSPQELTEALYFLASAGLKAGEVFPALEASARASAVGLGEVAQVGSVVAAVLNAYAGSGIRATDVTDILVSAVRESRAETDEFGQVLGRLLPISARAGITFGELAGSLASLSNIGLDVYEAATAMRAAIQAITAPGEKAANTMESMGVSAQEMLDAIHKRGLLGALQLLDKAIKQGTDTESEYLRTFRDIVPNVRALTGVLGLTGANLQHVQSIFEATTHATGDAAEAFRTTARGPAYAFRQAMVDLGVIGTEFGTHVLPIITDALQLIAPLLDLVAKNAGKLLVAFLAYKAISFVPVLLELIGTALIGLGGAAGTKAAAGIYATAKATGHLGVKAAVAEGLLARAGLKIKAFGAAGAKAAAGTALTAYALGDLSAAYSSTKTDLMHLESIANSRLAWMKSSELNTKSAAEAETFLNNSLKGQAEMYHGSAEALQYAVKWGVTYEKGLWATSFATEELNKHWRTNAKSLRQNMGVMDDAGKIVKHLAKDFEKWGFASQEAFDDFKKSLGESLQVGVGQFESFNDAFSVTPRELQTQLTLAVRIARTKHRDLKKIFDDKDLTRGQKLAVAALAPEMRNAWTKVTGAAQDALTRGAVQLARLNSTNVDKIVNPAKKKMKSGGTSAGHGWITGMMTAIREGGGSVVAAARVVVNQVLAMQRKLWGLGSPSKVAHQYGAWYIEGLIEGLFSRKTALNNAVENISNVLTDQLGKARDKYKDVLSKLKESLGENFTKEAYQRALQNNPAALAAEAAIGMARARVAQAKELQHMVNQAEKALDKIVEKFKTFKEDIKSGFADFSDLGSIISDVWAQYKSDMEAYQEALKSFTGEGDAPVMPTAPDFSQTIADTVAQAQRLAADLMAAAKAGLNKVLLAQFAGQGAAGADALEQLLANPALIEQLNQASRIIADAAGETASALGNKFFGKAIREATHDFQAATHALRMFVVAMIKALGEIAGAQAQMRHILQQMNAAMMGAPGGGGGGGGGGSVAATIAQYGGGSHMPGSIPAPTWKPDWKPTWEPTWKPDKPGSGGGGNNVTVNVHGWVGDDQNIAKKLRDELVRIGRNNGGTGL